MTLYVCQNQYLSKKVLKKAHFNAVNGNGVPFDTVVKSFSKTPATIIIDIELVTLFTLFLVLICWHSIQVPVRIVEKKFPKKFPKKYPKFPRNRCASDIVCQLLYKSS
jgi:hypothetical protein